MNLSELKELLQILDEKEIDEFELEESGLRLRIKKSPAAANHSTPPLVVAPAVPAILPPVMGVEAAPAAPSAAPSPSPAAPPLPAAAKAEEGLLEVKSPIVGTFYRSPDPGSPAFVNVGDVVKVGQVLCIIEAMKLMNEIEAETAGEIVRIHPESGQPVQYGEALFTLRPSR